MLPTLSQKNSEAFLAKSRDESPDSWASVLQFPIVITSNAGDFARVMTAI